MKTISQYVKEKNDVFEGVLIPTMHIEEGIVEAIKSAPSFFGTAFNICLNYAFNVKGYTPSFKPRIRRDYQYKERFNGIMISIDQKKPLSVREIALLTKEEQYYRSGCPLITLSLEELNALKSDYPIIKERIEWILSLPLKWETLVVEPSFSIQTIGLIGDGDFIIEDCLFELKCVKDQHITSRTQKQLMMYYLLNREGKKHRLHHYDIRQFGYINPIKKQFFVWNVNIPNEVMQNWMRFILQIR